MAPGLKQILVHEILTILTQKTIRNYFNLIAQMQLDTKIEPCTLNNAALNQHGNSLKCASSTSKIATMRKSTLAFDIYGTLIDTNGVEENLSKLVGQAAPKVSKLWREKQLEYSFRRGLMNRYEDFSVCTRDALNYACAVLKLTLSEDQKSDLLESYKTLPAFADVAPALKSLSDTGYPLYAFSNGSAKAVQGLLEHADITHHFTDVVSVEAVKTFKPSPDVYHHLLKRCASSADTTWVISSNPFDIIGAVSAGLNGAWLQRSEESVFDPWNACTPTKTITSLSDLGKAVEQ